MYSFSLLRKLIEKIDTPINRKPPMVWHQIDSARNHLFISVNKLGFLVHFSFNLPGMPPAE